MSLVPQFRVHELMTVAAPNDLVLWVFGLLLQGQHMNDM